MSYTPEEMRARFQQREAKIKSWTHVDFSPYPVSSWNWSDTFALNKDAKNKFDPAALDLNEQLQIVGRFIRFYFRGELDGMSVKNVLIEMISIATLGGTNSSTETIWKPSDYGYSTEEIRQLNCCKKNVVSSSGDVQGTSSCKTKHEEGKIIGAPLALPQIPVAKESQKELYATYKQEHLVLFYATIKELYDKASGAVQCSVELNTLRRLFGFIALTFLRFMVKSKTQMINAFTKLQYKKNVVALGGWPSSAKFSIPCGVCFDKCEYSIKRMYLDDTFLKVICRARYAHMNRSDKMEVKVLSYLRGSILNHTMLNGMSLLNMVNDISTHYGITWKDLQDLTDIESSTSNSWNAILKFMEENLGEDKQFTYAWAKVVNVDAFPELQCDRNPILSYILASNIQVWKKDCNLLSAHWAIKRKIFLQNFRPRGEAIDKLLKDGTARKSLCAAGKSILDPFI